MTKRPRVLFLCTGNSCRSQMAEGWLRQLAGERFDALSAGTHPEGVNPQAVAAMERAGWTATRIGNILGLNWLRLLDEVWAP